MNDEKTFPEWEKHYRETPVEDMPWFFEDLESDVQAALAERGIESGQALDLGTGPGTQAMALAQLGFSVTASDLSETAIKLARARAEEAGLTIDWRQDDILSSKLHGPYDLILDRGCFHVLAPADAQTYMKTVFGLLKQGGWLLLKVFSVDERGKWGPHRFAPADIEMLFGAKLEVVSIKETLFHGTLKKLPKALLAVMRRP